MRWPALTGGSSEPKIYPTTRKATGAFLGIVPVIQENPFYQVALMINKLNQRLLAFLTDRYPIEEVPSRSSV